MESPATMRRPCFIGEDDGLASIAEFSGNNNNKTNIYNNNNNNNSNNFVNYQNQPYMMRRKNSLRNISSLSTTTVSSASAAAATMTTTAVFSPRSCGRLFDPRFEEVHSPHFLESCALCHKPLGGNRDIFMYRGDTPFCTEECRQEQIEIDEAKEKNWNLKALRAKKEGKKSSSSPSKAQNYSFRTGTVAAA